jgi:heme exporter protein B
MMATLRAVLARDLTLALRDGASLGTTLGFALIVVAMMPLGLGPDASLLARIAPGAVWIAVLLAALLSTARIFESDHQDGSLAVLQTAPAPLELIVLVKISAHWLSTALPLVIAAPLLGQLLQMPAGDYPRLLASLALGTPAVSAVGAIGAALTLATRKSGLLIALLILPLYVPVLIFGISAMGAAAPGGSETALALLAAISLFCLVLAPFAAAAALRVRLLG